ncbi:MAG: hypothetical protein IV100_32665 [Myxococcales bacterium]|nr:hypothetical protein [Myxococcales bacterium]
MKNALLVAIIGALGGCYRMAEVHSETAPSSPRRPQSSDRVSAERCMFSLFHFIPFGRHPLPEAKHATIALAGGPLVNVDIETDWIWAVVGHVTCTRVTGTGPRLPSEPGNSSTLGGSSATAPVGATVNQGTEARVAVRPDADAERPATTPSPTTIRLEIKTRQDFDSSRVTVEGWVGTLVAIETKDGKTHRGTLVKLGDTWLGLVDKDGRKSKVEGRDLRTIEQVSPQ